MNPIDLSLRLPLLFGIEFVLNEFYLCLTFRFFQPQSSLSNVTTGAVSSLSHALLTLQPGCPYVFDQLQLSHGIFVYLSEIFLFIFFVGLLTSHLAQLIQCYGFLFAWILLTSSIFWSLAVAGSGIPLLSGSAMIRRLADTVFHTSVTVAGARVYAMSLKWRKYQFENQPFLVKILLYFPFGTPLWIRYYPYNPITLMCVLYFPPLILETILILNLAPIIGRYVIDSFKSAKNDIQLVGLDVYFTIHWSRLQMNALVWIFWITKMLSLTIFGIYLHFSRLWAEETDTFGWKFSQFLQLLWDYLLVKSCETMLSLLGTTLMMSRGGQLIGQIFQSILGSAPVDNEQISSGTFVSILFMILGLQTGLTGLSPKKRLTKLYRNVWLIGMATLYLLHQMLDEVLIRISTAGYYRWTSHARAWLVSTFLLIGPGFYALTYIYRDDFWNPWFIPVALYAFEVVIKTFTSLFVYSLFLFDSRIRNIPHLEDWIYWIRGIGSCLELICAFLLLLNGIWLVFFEQTSLIRATMIGLHAYLNVWAQAKEGWKSFQRRLQAKKRMTMLQNAPEERTVGEVCSICYQDLNVGSKVTNCGHVFHGSCLKRWLYMQDKCPLCHKAVIGDNLERQESVQM